MKTYIFAAGLMAISAAAMPAKADKLDDIIASGTLRCAVVLDFPPMGSRDANNNPIGFDVDYCNDLAKALGVTAEIVETTFPERIPTLMSGQVDVAVASTSDTLERAKTVGFSIPYYAFENAVVANDKVEMSNWEGHDGQDRRRHRRHLRGDLARRQGQGMGRGRVPPLPDAGRRVPRAEPGPARRHRVNRRGGRGQRQVRQLSRTSRSSTRHRWCPTTSR